MPVEVILPKVDMDMEKGKVGVWLAAPGDFVEAGAPLFEIETDKAAMEVEAPASGHLHHCAPAGTEAPIGAPVAWLYAEGEAVGDPPAALPSALSPALSPALPHEGAIAGPSGGAPGLASGLASGDGDAELGLAAPAPAPAPAPAALSGSAGASRRPAEAAVAIGADAAAHGPGAALHPGPAAAVCAGGGLRATPRARALAKAGGTTLGALAAQGMTGSGPRGRIQGQDAARALQARDAAAAAALRDAPPPPVQGDDQSPAPAAFAPPPAPAGFDAQPGPLNIMRSGAEEGTPFVLIHGLAADGHGWAPLLPYLEDRPVYRIELPCHGRSPRRRVADFAALAGMLREAFDALKLDRAHLVGHSLGGAAALALADVRARRLSQLTLIAPAGLGPQFGGEILRGILRAGEAASLAPWLRALVADPALIPDGYAAAAMAARRAPELRAAQRAMAGALFPDDAQAFDLTQALRRLEVPARILWGRADPVLPWSHALKAPGGVGLHLFDGVGHMPQLEATREIGLLLRRGLC